MARPKGTPNVITAAARGAFQSLLDGKADQLNSWIDRVAVDDPHRAFMMVMHLAAFCVPKPKPEDPPPAPLPDFKISFVSPLPCASCGHDPEEDLHITRHIITGPIDAQGRVS